MGRLCLSYFHIERVELGVAMYNLQNEYVIKEIKERKAKRVLLQLPEGLKPLALNIADVIEDATKTEVFISGDPCHGSCDLANDEAGRLKIDVTVHYGHTPLIKEGKSIIYVDARVELETTPAVMKALELLKNDLNIGLATTIQHVQELEKVKLLLEGAGKHVFIGGASGKALYDGQVSGCDYSTAIKVMDKVDSFLFIGGGLFHALGLALSTGKKVVIADPYRGESLDLRQHADKVHKVRWMYINEARKAKKFGIILGVKPGQAKVDLALKLKNFIESKGREAYIIAMREVEPRQVSIFRDVDVFIITACPRIAVDDAPSFDKPLILPLECVIGLREDLWEEPRKLWDLWRKGWLKDSLKILHEPNLETS